MEKEMICIVCPIGCHISVNLENYEVKGNSCPRGITYGIEEIKDPKRIITSTVKINNALDKRCPVKTSSGIPKNLNFKLMEELKKIELNSPVKRGDIIIKNFFNTGVNIIITKDM